MMTELLYDRDAYTRRFTAAVLSAEPAKTAGQWDIVLDTTAFFPEQGGQSADTGTLNGTVRVLDARISGGVIHHLCDGPLTPGERVEGVLDFDRRFSFMQQHTGEHILSGRCAAMYGCRNVGFHLSDRGVTVDYDRPLTDKQLEALETAANRAVWANLPVRCWYPTPQEAAALPYRSKKEIDGALRIVSIEGVDDCACCAPHVRSTGEVGLIKIISHQHYKGGVRLSILCGLWALRAMQEKQNCLDEISRMMTCGEDELLPILEKREAALKETKQALERLRAEALAERATSLRARGERVLKAEDADMPAMLRALEELAEPGGPTVGVFSGSDGAGYSFCLAGGKNLPDFFRRFQQSAGARGGGDAQLIRGKCSAGWETIAALFEAPEV